MPVKGSNIERYKELCAGIDKRVQLLFATQDIESFVCREAREVIEGAVELTGGKALFQPVEFTEKTEEMERFAIERIPCLAILGERDCGIRYYGIPSGYLFVTLLEAILLVGRGEQKIAFDTQSKLAAIQKPVHLRIFVTPTCPDSPEVTMLAHQFAYASDFIRADIIDITFFPYLANEFKVKSVPHICLDPDADPILGKPTEDDLANSILEATK
ncbi:MAG: thioredoxin family protein [Planctomycetota bacterium]|jgi:glutaredoxin-like protein